MSTEYRERTTAAIEQVDGLELVPDAVRLPAHGEPVPLERLAAATGRSVDGLEAALDEPSSAERDEHGRRIGLGPTLRPTAHRFTVGQPIPVEDAFEVDRRVVEELGWKAGTE